MKGNALARFIARSRRPRTGSWPGLSGGVASLKGIAFINWTIGTNGWELTERPVDSGLVTSSPQREPHTGSAAPGHDHDANDAPVLDRRAVLLAVGAAAALAACSAGEEELLGLPQPTFPPSAGGSGLDSEALGAVPGVPLPNIPFAEPRVPGGWGEVLGEYTESGPWQSAPAPQRSVPDEFNSRDGFAFPELSDEEIATAYADYKARVGLPAPPWGLGPDAASGSAIGAASTPAHGNRTADVNAGTANRPHPFYSAANTYPTDTYGCS
ncbi:hypothetical protein GQR58_030039 [Nymphon striatum]|nr:hypothetical protein GQR58_030039 [Nymphon striatum]